MSTSTNTIVRNEALAWHRELAYLRALATGDTKKINARERKYKQVKHLKKGR